MGIYLGDGYLANAQAKSPTLELSLDPKYPGIVQECSTAVWRVARTSVRISSKRTRLGEGIRLVATSPIWPDAFPQHGPGKKHHRRIALTSWQQRAVDQHPEGLLRGLIHSDGSRVINRFTIAGREYAYPRYFFTNFSTDIQQIFCSACDRVGVHWTKSSFKNISVSHRTSVEILDSFVGPKR